MRATVLSSIICLTFAQVVLATEPGQIGPQDWKSNCGPESPELHHAIIELSPWLEDLTKKIKTQPECGKTCSLIQKVCVTDPIVYFFAVSRTGELQPETLVQTHGAKAELVRALLLKAAPFKAPSNNLPLICQRGVEVKFFNNGSDVEIISQLGSRLRNAHIGEQNPIVHF
jgi:hypothetical protein